MLKAFAQKIQDEQIAAARPHAVVLIHGLGRSEHSLDALAKALKVEGYEVVGFNYPSNKAPIEIHAVALNQLIETFEGVSQVSFVTHSLGGIVLRQALNVAAPWRARVQLGRAVLLGPPNQGSQVARFLSGRKFSEALYGPALKQLADAKLGEKFPLPLTFATIAGTVNWLPFLKGVNDGLVSEAETRLNGAAQHLTLKTSHAFMMHNTDVMAKTSAFLKGEL